LCGFTVKALSTIQYGGKAMTAAMSSADASADTSRRGRRTALRTLTITNGTEHHTTSSRARAKAL
jgi:hypothetical protein